MRAPFLPMVLALAMVGSGCHQSFLGGPSDEGTIEYAMSFPDMDPDGLMTDMLPDRTILHFSRDHQSLDLSAGMGIFKTSMVINTPQQVVDYHMSVMGKSLMAEMQPRDLMSLNKVRPSLTVINTMARDTIAGLLCKQAYLIYDELSVPEAEVWYTEELNVEQPNWYGPFSEIPGVLMRYEVVQHNIRMRLEASKVKLGRVDAKHFEAKPDYQKVTPDVLYQQLDEVLGVFTN